QLLHVAMISNLYMVELLLKRWSSIMQTWTMIFIMLQRTFDDEADLDDDIFTVIHRLESEVTWRILDNKQLLGNHSVWKTLELKHASSDDFTVRHGCRRVKQLQVLEKQMVEASLCVGKATASL
ncbi:hypothetical protein Dimus_030882, partial [Dionaea muscipula]